MGRPLRAAVGAIAYHVLNWANARRLLFENDSDYGAFELVLAQTREPVAESNDRGQIPIVGLRAAQPS
jgi:putative transposase